jgi:hypothetical protein
MKETWGGKKKTEAEMEHTQEMEHTHTVSREMALWMSF